MTETTQHIPKISHHPVYTPLLQDVRSFFEQAIEDMEHSILEEHELEIIEPLSMDVLTLLEQEEQESLEMHIQKSKQHHWRTLPGLYKLATFGESAYDEAGSYIDEEIADSSSLPILSENQEVYAETVQIYDGLAEVMSAFESLSYKLTREVLGDRFAEMTRTLMKELEY